MRVFDSGVKIVEAKGKDMSLWDDEPCVTCSHMGTEHHYSPSGCGGAHCEHDPDDYGRSDCLCDEYFPPSALEDMLGGK